MQNQWQFLRFCWVFRESVIWESCNTKWVPLDIRNLMEIYFTEAMNYFWADPLLPKIIHCYIAAEWHKVVQLLQCRNWQEPQKKTGHLSVLAGLARKWCKQWLEKWWKCFILLINNYKNYSHDYLIWTWFFFVSLFTDPFITLFKVLINSPGKEFIKRSFIWF